MAIRERITNQELEDIFGESIPVPAFWMMLRFDNKPELVQTLREKLIEFQDARTDQGEITHEELSKLFPDRIAEKAKEIYLSKDKYTLGKKRRLFRELVGKRQIINAA